MNDLAGKIAVITGGASGIGKGMAEAFAAHGMKLVLSDVEKAALHATAGELREAGVEVLEAECDVRSAESVEALAERTYEVYGAAHVVCNNAGVGAGGPLWEVPMNDWKWVLEVNVMGIVHGIAAFVPRMIEGGDEGVIVNTASMAGFLSGPGMGPYNASKQAAVAITETLAYDLMMIGSKVSATALCPGWVNTKILSSGRNRPAEFGGAVEAPVGEMGLPLDVVANGHPPRYVGDLVVAAVRAKELYCFTDDEFGEIVEGRFAAVRARQKSVALPG